MPAAFYWHGTFGDDAQNPNNWSPNTSVPSSGDNVYFTTATWPGKNVACSNFKGTFASIVMTGGFTSPVTLSGTVNVGMLTVTSGSLRQPSGGTEINVSTSLSWSGGTLNDSTNLSAVNILGGAAAYVTPGTGTLTTGSHLYFKSGPYGSGYGATGTFNDGTTAFNNGADLEVNQHCSVHIGSAGMAGNVLFQRALDASQLLVPGGVVYTYAKDFESRLPVWVTGGTVQVLGDGHKATFKGEVGGTAGADSVVLGAGEVQVQHGATLRGEEGLTFGGGKFSTLKSGVQIQGAVKVEGAVTMSGADVVILADLGNRLLGDTVRFGVINFDSTINWTAGTFKPVVYGPQGDPGAATGVYADAWFVTGQVTIPSTGTATIAATAVGANGAATETRAANQEWLVIHAGGFVADQLPLYDLKGWHTLSADNVNPGAAKKIYVKS